MFSLRPLRRDTKLTSGYLREFRDNHRMKTFLLNPTLKKQPRFIREGRCMQKSSSWATDWPPITMALLGAIAKTWGPVRLLDGNVERVSLESLITEISRFGADLVVVNTGFPSIDQDMRVARRIKEHIPSVRVLAIGVYFTMLEKQAFEDHPFLDFAIIGEPETTFAELLLSLSGQEPELGAVKGLMFREGGTVRVNPARPPLDDLDSLPFPDRSLLKNNRYLLPHNNKPFTLINTARGCPYPCTFCIVNATSGGRSRRHSISYIIDEIRQCRDKYGIEEFLFWEEVFCLDKNRVREFCRALLDSGLRVRWAATTRIGSLDAATLAQMKEAGCYLIGLGIESGSQEILDAAKKQQTLGDIRRAVRLAQEAKIQTMGHFIFGLPGETMITAEETIRFMLELDLDYVQCYCAVPYPKTELGRTAEANGWIQSRNWSDFDFGGKSIMRTEALTPDQVDGIRRRAFAKFYFRPKYLLKKIFRDISFLRLPRVAWFFDWTGNFGALFR